MLIDLRAPRPRPWLRGVLAVAGGAAIASCSGQPPELGSDVSEAPTGALLSRVDDPPGRPPEMEVDGAVRDPLSWTWYDPASGVFEAGRDDGVTASDMPVVDASEPVEMFVLAPQLPAMVSVQTYRAVDDSGIPQDQGRSLDCSDVNDACALTRHTDRVGLALDLDHQDEVAFLSISVFYDLPQLGLEQPYDIVTYGVSVRTP